MFVNSVVDTLIDDDSYNSIIKDLIFDFNIIRVFTDIDTSFINVKDDDGNDVNPIIPIERFRGDQYLRYCQGEHRSWTA